MSTLRHICFDRILPTELSKPQTTLSSGPRLRAIAMVGKLWINGTVLRVRFMGGTPAQHAKVIEQANWWTEHANLSFDFNDAPDAEIRISFNTNDGSWSYCGTDCRSIPLDQPTMNLGFLTGGTPGHEFGHAIGLTHEHQNPAGGLQWNEEVVLREMSGSPNFWNEEQIRHNVLNKYRADQVNGTEFDPQSIMLYAFPGTWVKSGQGTQANSKLSPTDKAFIASARAYPKTAATADGAVELQVNAPRGTAASIGQPGEEDLFKFQVASTGTHIIDTLGPTDVVMKIYGPNSPTALIAEDDDSGVDTNASLSLNLVPGLYYVQIRHSNPDHGTGEYSVQVRRR